MTSKELSPEQVYAVGRAAVMNSLDLMSDALVLRSAGRMRRAFALAAIAVEELTKYRICRSLLEDWRGDETVASLRARLKPKGGKAHEIRYADTLLYLRALAPTVQLPPVFDDLRYVAREDMKARERCLYVDVHDSGVVMSPAGVKVEEADQWLEGMSGFFGMLGKVWAKLLDEALARARKT